MTTIEIPLAALDLLTVDGYCRRFFSILIEKDCTHTEAWEAVEQEFFAAFQKHKYSNFASFDVTKSRWKKRFVLVHREEIK